MMTRKTRAADARLARIAELQAELERLEQEVDGDPEPSSRRAPPLTMRRIKTLPPGFHSSGIVKGLYLDYKDRPADPAAGPDPDNPKRKAGPRLAPVSRYWVFRWKRANKVRDLGIGLWPEVSIDDAVNQALELRRKVKAGIDPLDEKKAARLAAKLERTKLMTFKQCAEGYIREHEASWRNRKHALQWPASLETYVYQKIGDLPVRAINTELVLQVLKPQWNQKTETLSRVRGRIESILDWAAMHGYRDEDAPNPAKWTGRLEKVLPMKSAVQPVEHLPALPYAELPEFMARLALEEGVASLALQVTVLTALRTGSVLGARWEEFDFDKRLWVVPAERMKGRRGQAKEHRVPLSQAVLTILEKLRQLPPSQYLFTANARKPLSDMSMLMLLRRMGRKDITVHGFRSAFADWCSEETDFAPELREMALAHTVSDAVEAAYRRGDLYRKRIAIMEAWAAHATGQTPTGTVVAFPGVA